MPKCREHLGIPDLNLLLKDRKMTEANLRKMAVLDQETIEIIDSIRDHHVRLGQTRAKIIMLQNRRGDIEMEREQLAYLGTLELEEQRVDMKAAEADRAEGARLEEEKLKESEMPTGNAVTEKPINYAGLGTQIPRTS